MHMYHNMETVNIEVLLFSENRNEMRRKLGVRIISPFVDSPFVKCKAIHMPSLFFGKQNSTHNTQYNSFRMTARA